MFLITFKQTSSGPYNRNDVYSTLDRYHLAAAMGLAFTYIGIFGTEIYAAIGCTKCRTAQLTLNQVLPCNNIARLQDKIFGWLKASDV